LACSHTDYVAVSLLLVLMLVIDAKAQMLPNIRNPNVEIRTATRYGQGGSASPQADAKITGSHRVEDNAIHP
jgi:hypothetical protein